MYRLCRRQPTEYSERTIPPTILSPPLMLNSVKILVLQQIQVTQPVRVASKSSDITTYKMSASGFGK